MVLTVFCVGPHASTHAVHRTVDSLCRHAERAVRDLGAKLWTSGGISVKDGADLVLLSPLLVCARNICAREGATLPESYPHLARPIPLSALRHERGTYHVEMATP